MIRVLAIALFAGIILWASAAPGRATARGKLRVLVVTGGHDFEREPFAAMLDSFGGTEWREVQHPKANDSYTPEQRRSYDVVLLYDMPQEITEEQKAWFVETLKEGKGLLVLHHALASYQAWPEYARIVGGKYLLAPEEIDGKTWAASTFRHDVTFTVRVADAKHPITRGLRDFTLEDEVYGGFWVDPKVRPLLRTEHPESGAAIGWTHRYGKARVVYLAGGHGATAYRDPSFRTLVQRSLKWVAGRY